MVTADPKQLEQVFYNLLANAVQAVSEAGKIMVRTALSGPGLVEVQVADDGPGISPEQRGRIFEPFFTTKPPGEGTGLGLSICSGIVKDHCGEIAVTSEPGQGTVFTVTLPVMEEETLV